MTDRIETHKFYECSCNRPDCSYCEGGLALCTICGGFEGTLTETCCGHELDEHTLDAVYKGGLDYIVGEWVVAPKEITSDYMRLTFWKQGARIAIENKNSTLFRLQQHINELTEDRTRLKGQNDNMVERLQQREISETKFPRDKTEMGQ